MYLKFLLFISIKIELIDPRPKLNNTQYIDFILLRNECYKLQDFKSEINTFINRSKNAVINKFKGSYKLTIAVGVSLFFFWKAPNSYLIRKLGRVPRNIINTGNS